MVPRKFIDLDEAAKMLGVAPDTVAEMRERGKIHGYRDGANWKFKPEEIERAIADREAAEQEGEFAEIDEDPDSILLSEVELGQSDDSTSSTIIGGKSSRMNPAESDIKLASTSDIDLAPVGDSDMDSALSIETKSGSDVFTGPASSGAGKKSDSGVSPLFDELDSLDLDLPSAADSGISSKVFAEAEKPKDAGSEITMGSDALTLEGSGLAFGSEDELSLGEANDDALNIETADGGSAIELASEEDDDLVLGGSSAGDLSRTGDSGISLFNASDSGLSLESAPLDLNSNVESLELGEDDDMILTEDEAEAKVKQKAPAGRGPAAEQESDDDFLLTPLDEANAEESDSGSQVIALDEDVEFEDSGVASLDDDGGLGEVSFEDAGLEEAGLGGGLLEDDLGGGLGSAGGLESGALSPMSAQAGGAAATAGAPAAAAVEAPFSGWNVMSLSLCAIMLLLVGMFMFDLLRNMWSWNGPYAVNSAMMNMVLSWFEGK